MELQVLFEDEYICVINKPSGIASQDSKQKDILSFFSNYFIVHRLDQRVSGVLLMAKNKVIAAKLNEEFSQNRVRKEYLTVTKTKPEALKAQLFHWHKHDLKSKKAIVSNNEVKDSKPVSLEYELINQSERYFLFKILLKTGRFHQIRAQFSAIGCPLVGDLKYGFARSTTDGSIFLHAHSLEFLHPITQDAIKVISDKPSIWSKYGL